MKWKDEELKLIIDNYLNYTDLEISKIFFNGKRSEKSIEKQRLKMGLKKKKPVIKWKAEELELLKRIYRDYTNEEISKIFFNNSRTKRAINEKGLELNLVKSEEITNRINMEKTKAMRDYTLGCKRSDSTKRKLSDTRKRLFRDGILISPLQGRIVSEEERIKSRLRNQGKWSGDKNPRHINPLFKESNGMWRGGITSLSQALRENILLWKKESMRLCNYKCILTGNNFSEIHHVYPFNKIIKKSLEELNLEVKPNLSYYENNGSDLIEKIQHNHKHLGLCLSSEIHKLFHDNYSYNNFNLNDFVDFTINYFNHIYDENLSESFKSINSKESLENVLNKLNKITINVY